MFGMSIQKQEPLHATGGAAFSPSRHEERSSRSRSVWPGGRRGAAGSALKGQCVGDDHQWWGGYAELSQQPSAEASELQTIQIRGEKAQNPCQRPPFAAPVSDLPMSMFDHERRSRHRPSEATSGLVEKSKECATGNLFAGRKGRAKAKAASLRLPRCETSPRGNSCISGSCRKKFLEAEATGLQSERKRGSGGPSAITANWRSLPPRVSGIGNQEKARNGRCRELCRCLSQFHANWNGGHASLSATVYLGAIIGTPWRGSLERSLAGCWE